MDSIENYGEMWGNLDPGSLLIVLAMILVPVIIIVIWKVVKAHYNKISQQAEEKRREALDEYHRQLEEEKEAKPKEAEDGKDKKNKKEKPILEPVGVGMYKAYFFNDKENCVEPTRINRPIGTVFNADTTMPVIGGCYLVQRDEDTGKLIPYDPRDVPFKSKSSPEWAYFATHWAIVKSFFATKKDWWQMAPAWVAAASVAAAVFVIMVVLG